VKKWGHFSSQLDSWLADTDGLCLNSTRGRCLSFIGTALALRFVPITNFQRLQKTPRPGLFDRRQPRVLAAQRQPEAPARVFQQLLTQIEQARVVMQPGVVRLDLQASAWSYSASSV
jgi:hypothetical protein